MDAASRPQPKTVKVAVLGTSNSVMRRSYAEILSRDPAFAISNKSIGGTTSILSLDFVAVSDHFDFDFLILETAVIDFAEVRVGNYLHPMIRRNLEVFIQQVRSRSRCQIIFLVIPHRRAFLEAAANDIEQLYLSIAEAHSIPVFNLFALFRKGFNGDPRAKFPIICHYARLIIRVLALPGHLDEAIVWRASRNENLPSNALAYYGYKDTMHISQMWHRIIARILGRWMTENCRTGEDAPATAVDKPLVTPSYGRAPPRVVQRRSSLISRDLAALSAGEAMVFDCGPDQRAVGLLINRAKTSSYVTVSDGKAAATFDCTFGPLALEWVATILPIINEIGGQPIKVAISDSEPGSGSLMRMSGWGQGCQGGAEIGELILTPQELLLSIDHTAGTVRTIDQYINIENLPWAQEEFSAACEDFQLVAADIESDFVEVPQLIAQALRTCVGQDVRHDEVVEKARHFVMHGDLSAARDALAKDGESPLAKEAIAAINRFLEVLGQLR